MHLSDQDLERLRRHGISGEAARRQYAVLRRPPTPPAVLRPCTIDDGIERWDPVRREVLAAAGRARLLQAPAVVQFLPASGAASRMFADLAAAFGEEPAPAWRSLEARAWRGELAARSVLRLLADLPRLPFAEALAAELAQQGEDLETLRRRGRWRPLLAALLGTPGLGLAGRPKALIPFHRAGSEIRTALEEQLDFAGDCAGTASLPFAVTIAPGQEAAFEQHLAALRARQPRAASVHLITQPRSTDTLAVDEDGELLRDAAGHLLLRPGGHGSLLQLLPAAGSWLLLRNIDNILPPGPRRQETASWRQALLGRLVELAAAIDRYTMAVAAEVPAPADLEAAGNFLDRHFGPRDAPAGGDTRSALLDRLRRPLRVCAMVPLSGEPGGGPYWVREGSEGAAVQILEGAQLADPPAGATHFHPVEMACRIPTGDEGGADLDRYVDPTTAIVTARQVQGRAARVLEHPGLWNGGMAGWNSLFVELPESTFAPVKTVLDLLRPEHQPPDLPAGSGAGPQR